MDVAGRTYWTRCAFDAIGIPAAIGLDGTIRTSEPETGSPIEIAFDRGQPALSSAVLLLPAMGSDSCANVIDDGCSLANLFTTEARARDGHGRATRGPDPRSAGGHRPRSRHLATVAACGRWGASPGPAAGPSSWGIHSAPRLAAHQPSPASSSKAARTSGSGARNRVRKVSPAAGQTWAVRSLP